MRNGFFDGVGWPLGRREGDEDESPWKEANADGVRDVASAGGGRPVIFAKSVLSHRRRANIPRMEPRVVRRLENCSATPTNANGHPISKVEVKGRKSYLPKKLECVAMYVLSSICAMPPNAPTKLSII